MKNNTLKKIELLKKTFRLDLKNRISQIEDAFNKNNYDDLYKLIHSLVGAGGTFGEKEITKSALNFEKKLKLLENKEEINFLDLEIYLNDLKNVCSKIINRDLKK